MKPVLLPRYKKILQNTQGHATHGKCVVIVSWTPEEVVMCDQPVARGFAGNRWQICRDHIHAPAILLERGTCDGRGEYVRFCHHNNCHAMLPLESFYGLSPVCKSHARGRVRAGIKPVAPPQPVAAEAVVDTAVQLETLQVGMDRPLYQALPASCDVQGCDEPPQPPTHLCCHHRKVRSAAHPIASLVLVESCVAAVCWTVLGYIYVRCGTAMHRRHRPAL